MKRSLDEILADIDTTLDQLIQNAGVIDRVSVESLCENEIEALQKTQESLLARLMHIEGDQKFQIKKKMNPGIQQKIAEFGRLNARLIHDVATKFGSAKEKKPRIARNRKKAKQLAVR